MSSRFPGRRLDAGRRFNANGIAETPDRKALLVVQSNTGFLFRVDPETECSDPSRPRRYFGDWRGWPAVRGTPCTWSKAG